MIVLRRRIRVWLALWVALFAVYAATIPLAVAPGQRYAADEPHHLLGAAALADHGSLDATPEYRAGEWRSFTAIAVTPLGHPVGGLRDEPTGPLVALMALPAWALGGADAVALEWAAMAALAFVLAGGLARRMVPEPWATGGVCVVALSPPALAWSTTVGPEVPAALALTAAVLMALLARERPKPGRAAACGLLVAPLPWLGSALLVPAAVLLVTVVSWLARRSRGLAGLVAIEALLASMVMLITISDRLYGGLTPSAAGSLAPGAARGAYPGDPIGHVTRLVSVWLDRDAGLLRWAPVLALAGVATWSLWRSRRERVSRALSHLEDVELALGVTVAVVAAGLVPALLAPWLTGPWFPGRGLVPVLPMLAALTAAGLRRMPRTGALLAAITLVASVWLVAGLVLAGGGWSAPTDGPWAGIEGVLPRWGTGSAGAAVLSLLPLAAIGALVLDERRRRGRRRPEALGEAAG